MADAPFERAFSRLAQRIEPGARLLRAWPLTGGVSARITALELAQPDGATVKLVVREHGERDRAANPHIARDEYRLMQIVQTHGIAAPAPYFLDEACDLFPNPVVVVAFIDGETDVSPHDPARFISQLAAQLANIHRMKDSPELAFLPRRGEGVGQRPARLDDSLDEGRIRDALEASTPITGANAPVLLHGDYWPGNILWKDGALIAVIDWEDAAIGDPLCDLANCRLELLWSLGPAAMTEFTHQYRALANVDLTNLPYRDLFAALGPCGKLSGWGLGPATEQRMRERHHQFVEEALRGLAAG